MRYTLFFLFITQFLLAQNHNYELWNEYEIEYKVSKKIGFSLTEELKFKYNSPYFFLNTSNSDLGFSYSFNKNNAISLTVRNSLKFYNNSYFNGLSNACSYQFKYKLNNIKVSYRNKLEFGKSVYFNEPSDTKLKIEDRNKLKLSYSAKDFKISPNISIESFSSINSFNRLLFFEIRYSAGMSIDLKRKFQADISYILKKEFNQSIPGHSNILLISIYKEI